MAGVCQRSMTLCVRMIYIGQLTVSKRREISLMYYVTGFVLFL